MQKSSSWGIIALWLFLFFPVGIYLIIKKMTSEKLSNIENGKSLRVLGYILLGCAAVFLIMAVSGEIKTEDGSSIVGRVVVAEITFVGCGALCVFKGIEYIKRGTKYNRYVAIINASNDLLVDNIAAAMSTTYDKAVEDIQSMLDAGYFTNSYLDLKKRELIMAKSKCSYTVNTEHDDSQDAKNNQPYSMKCPNCGATNTIVPGAKNECEYCGSPL
jgi:hypothetical protein